MNAPYRRRGIMEQRRETVDRIEAMTVQMTEVFGRVMSIGAGELAIDIPFPVNFTERPLFTFGAEMEDNHRAVLGSYPTVSAVVVTWNKSGEVEGAFDGYYLGATIVVRTTGGQDQHMWTHYSFMAKAIVNPVNILDTVEDVI